MKEGSTQFHDAIAKYDAEKFSNAFRNVNALAWLTQKYEGLTPVELLLEKLDEPNAELQKMFNALVEFIQNSLVKYFADEYPKLLSVLNTFGRDRIVPILSPMYATFIRIVEKEKIDLKKSYLEVHRAFLDLERKLNPKKLRTKTFVSGESFSHLEPAFREAAKKKDTAALKKLLKDLPGKMLWTGSHGQSLVFVFRHLPDVRDFLLANGAEITLKDLELSASCDRDVELLKTLAVRYNKTRPVQDHYVVGDTELSENEAQPAQAQEDEDSLSDDWVMIPGKS